MRGLLLLALCVCASSAFAETTPRGRKPTSTDGTTATAAADLARGRYLAEHVLGCVDCHSRRDFDRYGGPVMPGTEGGGGDTLGEAIGLPGSFHPPNITPTRLGGWSDEDLRKAVFAGVRPDGSAIFPVMPWQAYAQLCEADARAVLTWVRDLKPLPGNVPASVWKIPKPPAATIATPRQPERCPDQADSVAYGRYLVTMASCSDCHTPMEEGRPSPSKYLAGGAPLPIDGRTIVPVSANITPHPTTGIGGWTRAQFIHRFKSAQASAPVGADEPNTFMPWPVFAGMSERDLGAMYDYLRTVPPVDNAVVKFK